MTPARPLTPTDFDRLVHEHLRVIRAVNDLELQLHRLGDVGDEPRVLACQQAGGALIGLVRGLLDRYDQHLLPLIEARLVDR